ncbi:hypothetical protein [Sphingomonas sp. BAUL-RG-20F-R05-02]|uniref:hypothetical protein n=1 Tax=Sphingomonas sp. BAUL-RG-20F-R05-02 TaxID=2914830 RepID=UPI001F56D5F6|nr:hypothetical protein [Sphingomonas sp. BAUL-RG-20F-R05-02]
MATTLDPNRAAFVTNEYRYVTPTSPTVKSRNPAAREVKVDTNLDQAAATALAAKYLAENIQPRVLEIVLQGIINLDAFIGGPPSYIPNFPKLATDGRTMKVIGATVDYGAGKTTVRVRG